MANVGTAAAGKTLIGAGNGSSPTYASIGTNSGLAAHGVLIAEGNSAFSVASPATTGKVLMSNGALTDPSFQDGGAFVGNTITGNSGGALPPSSGNWNILGSSVAAGTSPVVTSGTASTLTVNVQKSQAIAATDATKIGLSNFNSAQFSVDANGFVSAINAGFAWTDVSGAFSPLAENGYFITGTATGTLPASPTQGNTIKFFVDHASQVLTIQAAGSQIIRMANQVSSAGGTSVSTLQGDSCELVYRSSNTCWEAVCGFSGIWNLS